MNPITTSQAVLSHLMTTMLGLCVLGGGFIVMRHCFCRSQWVFP